MKLNQQLMPSKNSKSSNRHIVATTSTSVSGDASPSNSVSVSGEVSPSKNNQTEQVGQPKRDLAWQVASNLLVSFKYAWAGLRYGFGTQRNFRIHVAIGILAISLGIFLHLSPVEMSLIGITIGLVLAMELINTAIESVVDLTVKQTYHELAKIAKDCAAGAVLVSALAAILVAGSLLLPPLFALVVQSNLFSIFN
ncbi:diacylglycerol kinase [Aerosakkonemataceae cyanobacterium BLCC-F50]|uniref:Diacylglycerol kinase n=1 Tax=Floridaenema flaviceps BLCC-F50 TaxID=3153642 RepID=A0ABV4XV19_9CYAN